jgi:Zn-dependent alcohol dehydrogenase
MKFRASVTRQKGQPFSIEKLDLEAPRANEVLGRIVGVGVCHTDVKVRDGVRPEPTPSSSCPRAPGLSKPRDPMSATFGQGTTWY